MGRLRPTIAVADYDRTRALLDGRVAVEGCDPVWLSDMPIETMFSRALGSAEFDVSELSFSNFLNRPRPANAPMWGCRFSPAAVFATAPGSCARTAASASQAICAACV